MKLYVSEYNKDQGKSYTTIYYVSEIHLDADEGVLTFEATEASGNSREFKFNVGKP